MDLQFDEKILKCLQCAVREYQTQEQTQELRIPEDMPDVGIVLGAGDKWWFGGRSGVPTKLVLPGV